MTEIEVKLQFRNTDIKVIKNSFSATDWSEPYTQHDRIFLDKLMTEYKITPGMQVCRIRKEISSHGSEELSLTMKVQQTRALHSLELKTTINNEADMAAMLNHFGFEEFLAVSKIRIKTRIESYNLCLDEVKDLGTFLEIELLTEDDTDAKEVQSQMIKWVRDQGLGGFEVNMIPYDTQMYNFLKTKRVINANY